MGLMRVMHIVMGVVKAMVRIMNIVMGTMDTVMGIVYGRMRGVAWYKRIGQAKRVGVSLITIPGGWTAPRGHMIPW